MDQFEGYGKIFETSSHWILEKSDIAHFKRTSWCVTEKIHGANFCFLCDEDGKRIRCAKRTGLLEDSDDFFGYKRRILAEMTPKTQQIFHQIKKDFPLMDKLYIFGEIFGGFYPHPDVPAILNVSPIQTGIWYSPDIEFCVFDIAISIENSQSYLDYAYVLRICSDCRVFVAEPLFIGKYEEALDFKLGFQSHVPSKLKLPILVEDNRAEGIVIKPMRELKVKTTRGSTCRAIVKKKIPEFAEEKYGQAQKLELKNDGQLSNLELLRFEIDACITENRLHNALSKVGHVTEEDRDKLKELLQIFVSDVMDQINENGNGEQWNSLHVSEQNLLTQEITTAAKKVILKWLKSKRPCARENSLDTVDTKIKSS